MIEPRHTLIDARAGCGKTTRLLDVGEKALARGERVLYLSFNRNIREEVMESGRLRGADIHTIHSLCYADCRKEGYLDSLSPEGAPGDRGALASCDFGDLILDMDRMEEAERQRILNGIVSRWPDCAERSGFDAYSLILVDELQDLNDPMIRVVRGLMRINRKNGARLVAAGDRRQRINSYLGDRNSDPMAEFRRLFGAHDTERLSVCRRCSPSIQRFVNGFLPGRHGPEDLFDLSGFHEGDYSRDVTVVTARHRRDVAEEVRGILEAHPTGTVAILGRTGLELEEFKSLSDADPRIAVSTIHKAKGSEYDIAVVVNTVFGDDLSGEEANVRYVAFTRARLKLYLISSFPERRLLEHFTPGTYALESRQGARNRAGNTPRRFSLDRLTPAAAARSVMDSVELSLALEDAPFIPYEKQNLEKISPFSTDTRMELRGLSFVLHRRPGRLVFDFRDLNPLKKEGMDDAEIASFLRGVVCEYFDGRMDEDDLRGMRVNRLDLAALRRAGSPGIMGHLATLAKTAKYSSSTEMVRTVGEEGAETVYLNPVKDGTRTLRFYRPGFKNRNVMMDADDVVKVEISRRRRRNEAGLDLDFGQLMDRAGNLEATFREWMAFEFPFLFARAPATPERFFSNHGIASAEDAARVIIEGGTSRRTKRALFHAYLSFCPKELAEDLRRVFGSPEEDRKVQTEPRKGTRPPRSRQRQDLEHARAAEDPDASNEQGKHNAHSIEDRGIRARAILNDGYKDHSHASRMEGSNGCSFICHDVGSKECSTDNTNIRSDECSEVGPSAGSRKVTGEACGALLNERNGLCHRRSSRASHRRSSEPSCDAGRLVDWVDDVACAACVVEPPKRDILTPPQMRASHGISLYR